MDMKSVAEGLVQAVGELSDSERNRLRRITDLASDETDLLKAAVADQPRPISEMALRIIDGWDHMMESERVASLLVLREILIRELREDGPLQPRR